VGSARLRITFSAKHSVDDVRELIRTLRNIEQQTLEKNSL
jgi:8-amino-7-oxononanoate synthase